jgi:hypothetical protein
MMKEIHKCVQMENQLQNKGVDKMKKNLFGTMVLVLAMVIPLSALAQVDIHVSVPLPPAVVFSVPPVAVVIPGTYVYGVPDPYENIFFYDGWWWRPWEGRWYRSRYYGSGWAHYRHVPSFYKTIPPDWRNDYRQRHWHGHPWDYQQVSPDQLHHNWKGWKKDKHWEKKNNWGVKGMNFQSHSRKDQPEGAHPRHHGQEEHDRHLNSGKGQPSLQSHPPSHPQRELGHKHQGAPDREEQGRHEGR